MKKQILKKLAIHTTALLALVFVFAVPMLAVADVGVPTATPGGFILCDGVSKIVDGKVVPDPCTFEHVMGLLRFGLNFVVYKMITPVFVIMLMWQGIKMITSSVGGAKSMTLVDLKKNMQTLLFGYLWVLAAWLIVKTVIVILAGETPSFDVFFN